MITDHQRFLARIVALSRESRHRAHGSRDSRISGASDDFEAGVTAHRKGLLGELEFANVFGTPPDLAYRRNGDGGADHRITLRSGKVLTLDVKTSSYQGADQRIKVPVGKLHSGVVYVAARLVSNFLGTEEDVELVGWIAGAELLARNEIRNYTRLDNYTAPYEALHPLEPLIMMTAQKSTP